MFLLTAAAGSLGARSPAIRAAAGDAAVSRPSGALRIAVVQQEGRPGEVSRNRESAVRFAGEALQAGADVVLFHEALLTGYVPNVRDLSEEADGPTTRVFHELLRGSTARIIYGLTERAGGRFYASALVVSGTGLVANYRKTHLYPNPSDPVRDEPSVFTPGTRLTTFQLGGPTAGLLICFDGDFPEMMRAYANLGCQIVFWLNNRYSRGYAEVKRLAVINSMIVATSCCSGKGETGEFYPGGSNITGPRGELLAEIWGKEGVIAADVWPSHVPQLRAKNVFFTSQQPALYARPRP
jgi:predicted amidohydrolase